MPGLDVVFLIAILWLCCWLGARINTPPKKNEKSLEEKFGENFRDIITKAVKAAYEEGKGKD